MSLGDVRMAAMVSMTMREVSLLTVMMHSVPANVTIIFPCMVTTVLVSMRIFPIVMSHALLFLSLLLTPALRIYITRQTNDQRCDH